MHWSICTLRLSWINESSPKNVCSSFVSRLTSPHLISLPLSLLPLQFHLSRFTSPLASPSFSPPSPVSPFMQAKTSSIRLQRIMHSIPSWLQTGIESHDLRSWQEKYEPHFFLFFSFLFILFYFFISCCFFINECTECTGSNDDASQQCCADSNPRLSEDWLARKSFPDATR